jgi:two-component system, chemotaxis family, chemotaxis protein CheY
MPSVLVVDDEDDFRYIIRWMLEEAGGGWYVVGEAASAETAVAYWRELRPDVIIIDHLLQGPTGLQAAEQILFEDPGQRIVLLTMIWDEETHRAARALGVAASVSKVDLRELTSALREVTDLAARQAEDELRPAFSRRLVSDVAAETVHQSPHDGETQP